MTGKPTNAAPSRHSRPAASRRTLWDGVWYPSAGPVFGLPSFRFRCAPTGLATRRQLRVAGLCPGGRDPVAVLIWRRGRRWAWLFRLDLAQPKRRPSTAQLSALDRAMTARRCCRTCNRDAGYCVPTSTRRCWPCELAGPDENGSVVPR